MAYYFNSLKLKSTQGNRCQFDDLGSAIIYKLMLELREKMFKKAPDRYLSVKDKLFGGYNKKYSGGVAEFKKVALEGFVPAKEKIKKEAERILADLAKNSDITSCDINVILNDLRPLIVATIEDLDDPNMFVIGINAMCMDEGQEKVEFIKWAKAELVKFFDEVLVSIDYYGVINANKKIDTVSEEFDSTKALVETDSPVVDGGVKFDFTKHPEFYPVIQGTEITVANEEAAKELAEILGTIADKVSSVFGGNIILYMRSYQNNSNFILDRMISRQQDQTGVVQSYGVDPRNLAMYVGVSRADGRNDITYPTISSFKNEAISSGMNDPYCNQVKSALLRAEQMRTAQAATA